MPTENFNSPNPETAANMERMVREKFGEPRNSAQQFREGIAAMQAASDSARPLTFGEKAVSLTFNPSGDEGVNKAKRLYAAIIDQLNDLRGSTESGEVKRLCSAAITEAQGAQMWAVKAVTWKD
jgi:hypothetical protein